MPEEQLSRASLASASRAGKEQRPRVVAVGDTPAIQTKGLALCLALVAACKRKAIDLPSEETKKKALHHDAFYEIVSFVSRS